MPGQGIFHYFKRLVQVTDSVDRTARSRLRLEEQTKKKLGTSYRKHSISVFLDHPAHKRTHISNHVNTLKTDFAFEGLQNKKNQKQIRYIFFFHEVINSDDGCNVSQLLNWDHVLGAMW